MEVFATLQHLALEAILEWLPSTYILLACGLGTIHDCCCQLVEQPRAAILHSLVVMIVTTPTSLSSKFLASSAISKRNEGLFMVESNTRRSLATIDNENRSRASFLCLASKLSSSAKPSCALPCGHKTSAFKFHALEPSDDQDRLSLKQPHEHLSDTEIQLVII